MQSQHLGTGKLQYMNCFVCFDLGLFHNFIFHAARLMHFAARKYITIRKPILSCVAGSHLCTAVRALVLVKNKKSAQVSLALVPAVLVETFHSLPTAPVLFGCSSY